jgi:exosome complex component RRP42
MTNGYEIVPNIEKKRISELLTHDKRLDGRGMTDYRPIKLEIGIIDKALGSAQVSLGKTKVLVGIKMESGTPFPDKPDKGVLITNAELIPLASPLFESGPPREKAVELARVVDRGIRESKAVDTKKLCIVPGKKVFLVFVDIYILDYDGNLFDASALAAIAALLTSKMREYTVNKKGEVKFKKKFIKLPVNNYPIEVTLAKINDRMIVDPSLDEEMVMDAQITIAIDKDNKICAMQKSNSGTFSSEEVVEAVRIAKTKTIEIRETILKGILDE